MKKKKTKNFLCQQCDRYFTTSETAVKHCHIEHPETPEICYDQFGDTWDETLTRLVRVLASQRAEVSRVYQIQAERDAVVRKLQAIVLVLNSTH